MKYSSSARRQGVVSCRPFSCGFLGFFSDFVYICGKVLENGSGAICFLGVNPFAPHADREGKVRHVLQRIRDFFQKYFEIAGGKF